MSIKNDKLIRRALLQGSICKILENAKLNVDDVKIDN
jgi:hypothetical protein